MARPSTHRLTVRQPFLPAVLPTFRPTRAPHTARPQVSLFQANPEADEVLYKTPEVEYWINSNFNSYVQAANGSFVPRDPNASVVTAFAKISATLSTVVRAGVGRDAPGPILCMRSYLPCSL